MQLVHVYNVCGKTQYVLEEKPTAPGIKVLIATLKMLNLDTKREVKEEQELLKVRLN